MAGFAVFMNGRFWVFTEGITHSAHAPSLAKQLEAKTSMRPVF
jgi:hypothetical protein